MNKPHTFNHRILVAVNQLLLPLNLRLYRLRDHQPLEDRYVVKPPLVVQAITGMRNPVVLDVGASEGDMVAFVLEHAPAATIYAFEPQPDEASSIRARFKDQPGVHVFQVGVGEKPGMLTFHVNEKKQASSFLTSNEVGQSNAPFLNETDAISVEVICLDDWYQQLATPPAQIDLLKLDVQGYEPNVLRGATEVLKRTRAIVVEAALMPMYEGQLPYEQLIPVIQQHGFSITAAGAGYHNKTNGHLIEVDVLLTRSQA